LTGYTGSLKYEFVGIVHRAVNYALCSCGGYAWIYSDGKLNYHSEPVDPEAEHLIAPLFGDKIWQYELVE